MATEDPALEMPESQQAMEALLALVDALVATQHDLERLQRRADQIVRARERGVSWSQLVETAEPPLLVQTLATVQDRLNSAGVRWRRAEALALHAEGMSMEAIAEQFGVTRQRISALLRGTH